MQRLKTRPQFQATLAGGTVARTAHFALHRLTLDAGSAAPSALAAPATGPALASPLFDPCDQTWLGAMVPKRWARRAVTRNAIKRQIYNLATGCGLALPQAAYVVRLRATFDRKQFVSASSDLLKLAVRAELLQLFERATTARQIPVRAAGARP